MTENRINDLNENVSFPVVTFGRYPQGRFGENKPIEWFVLDAKDGKVLLLSKYAIEWLEYDKSGTKVVTWKTCALRKWLHEWFYNVAFNEAEQKQIVLTELVNDVNPEFRSEKGCNSTDKVFLLSAEEVEKYLPNEESRICGLTDYMRLNKYDDYTCSKRKTCAWHLRTLCSDFDSSARVTNDGRIAGLVPSQSDYSCGQRIGIFNHWAKDLSCFAIMNFGVRPAVWVNFDS